jgi:hypothetical protein
MCASRYEALSILVQPECADNHNRAQWVGLKDVLPSWLRAALKKQNLHDVAKFAHKLDVLVDQLTDIPCRFVADQGEDDEYVLPVVDHLPPAPATPQELAHLLAQVDGVDHPVNTTRKRRHSSQKPRSVMTESSDDEDSKQAPAKAAADGEDEDEEDDGAEEEDEGEEEAEEEDGGEDEEAEDGGAGAAEGNQAQTDAEADPPAPDAQPAPAAPRSKKARTRADDQPAVDPVVLREFCPKHGKIVVEMARAQTRLTRSNRPGADCGACVARRKEHERDWAPPSRL